MPFLILDLEMSGSEAGYHEIIQIGCVLADDHWKELGEFESLVYPENDDSFSILSEKVHGFSLEDLEDAPMAYDVLEDLEAWVRGKLGKRPQDSLKDVILCGQSVINDIHFLRTTYSDLNLNWPFSEKLIDLMSMSYLLFRIMDANGVKRPSKYSLNAVAAHFSIKREQEHHDALEDARITYRCFQKYDELATGLKF